MKLSIGYGTITRLSQQSKGHRAVLSGLVTGLLVIGLAGPGQTLPEEGIMEMTIAQGTPQTVSRPVLRFGSKGTEVGELQGALKLLGYYNGAVDGVYAESTVIAVSQFQKAAGLKADGITGPTTWNRLFPATTEAPPTPGGTAVVPAQPVMPPAQPAATPPQPATRTTPTTSSPTPATPASPTATLTAANPTPAATNSGDFPILRLGMRGTAVIGLQERLKALGLYSGRVDGVFGSGTQTAVRAAQRKYKLQSDGIVGPTTWRAIMR
ncbi:MAG: peptidoglycan-binding protein [Leptolyngbyaceae cyanobacterium bins.59]|nr:peptidoglycan-binding protein [Leptolyngbyaceae cyanobacterium bins.59]